MIKIGITGGIGSGKSVVATLLALSGVPVYIADEESKRLTATSPVIREKLTGLLGEAIYPEGQLDKRRLADRIFRDPDCLRQVNAIIHPEVDRHFQAWAARQHTPCCAIESAILFESGFDRIVDVSLMVYAPLEVRVNRVLSRDQTTRAEVLRRIENQFPDETKKERADYVIENDDRRALIPQVAAFLAGLR